MYIPDHFAPPSIEAMGELMRRRPFATLVTLAGGGLDANHIPMLFDAAPEPHGILRGHVARANPAWRDLARGAPALAIFHGPDAYVTPTWYASKRETGKVVPTWNYAVVHARGTATAIEDGAWLRDHLEALTNNFEADFPVPWAVADAPTDYVERLATAIVGIELVISGLSGKWKLSQNQPVPNREGVVRGLSDSDAHGAQAVAALMVEAVRRD